jgi:signal transduction histidine kinase
MPASQEPARILVVDDDVGMLVLMAEALRSEGYAVETAGSGAAALALAARRLPDLMIVDLKMRDIGGPALVDRLRAEARPVPFIVVTGQGDEKVAVEVMKQGALDYVMKDSGLLHLLPTVVRRALAAVERELVLASSQAKSRRLEREIVRIGETERQRIGADLHDGLGQLLTAIELYCTGLKEDASRTQPELASRLERMGGMLREAVAQTRLLARGLAPIGEDPDALRTGLAELAERTTAAGRIPCRFECPDPVPVRDGAVAGHLYRIAQEAVNNALKHAGAGEVTIRLSHAGGALRLQVADDGKGMSRVRGRGIGLDIMRHRAGVIGAELDVASNRGGGTVVTCVLPTPS